MRPALRSTRAASGIRDPLAIQDAGAGGNVVEGTGIAECLAAGAGPAAPGDAVVEAGRRIVIPCLVGIPCEPAPASARDPCGPTSAAHYEHRSRRDPDPSGDTAVTARI